MLPGVMDLEIYQGDRHEIGLFIQEQIWNEATKEYIDGERMDLTGYTVRAQIRTKKTDENIAAEYTCTVDPDQETNPGAVLCVLLPSQTQALTEGSYVWDIEFEQDPQNIFTYVAGSVKVVGGVTRASS